MPLKPLNTPDIWASDDDWIVGPKSGLKTKTPVGDAIAAAGQGHIPGNLFPTTANEFNRWCFEVSEELLWVFLGTFLPDLDAHIIETNDDGRAQIATAILGGTLATGPSLTVLESAVGAPNQLIQAVDDVALKIEHVASDNGSPWSPSIVADSDRLEDTSPGNSYLWTLTSTPTTAITGPGGLQVKTDGFNSDTNGNIWATIKAFNNFGIAGLFESTVIGTAGTLEANNAATQGVALYLGLRNPGPGMLGISSKGGDGSPALNVPGGLAGEFRGGLGLDGANDVDGGKGLLAQGGSAISGTPGLGAEIRSGGAGVAALLLRHNQESGQTEPLLSGNTGSNIGGGITMDCFESSHGASFATQGGNGITLLKSESATFQMGVHMFLQPIIDTPPTVFFSDGDLWFTRTSAGGSDLFDLKMFADGPRYLPLFTSPVVYGWNENSTQVSNATIGTVVVFLTVNLSPELAPSVPNAEVIITVHCYVVTDLMSFPTVSAGKIIVTDDTAAVLIPDGERQIDLINQSVRHPLSYSFEYTIPAAGPRSFSFGIEKDNAAVNFISVGGSSVEIKTKWDQ